MSDTKTIAAVVALVLVIIGVLIGNYVCDECLFEFPEGGGTTIGGASHISPTTETTSGSSWAWLIILVPLICIGSFFFKKKFWPPDDEDNGDDEDEDENGNDEDEDDNGNGKKRKERNYPLIPREILGKWRKEILGEKYCEKVGNFDANFANFVENRMNDCPYPMYLLFKGWIDSAKPGNNRFHIDYPKQFCRARTNTFEKFMRKGLNELLRDHKTISSKFKSTPNSFLKRMVEAYARTDKKDVKIDFLNENTDALLTVFNQFIISEYDSVFKQINATRQKMGAPELDEDIWMVSRDILTDGNFKSKGKKIDTVCKSVEESIYKLLFLINDLKNTKGQTRTELFKTTIPDQIAATFKSIDTNLRVLEDVMGDLGKALKKKIKNKKDKKHEDVLIVLDEIFGPPMRILIGRIGLLALMLKYVELKENDPTF